MINELPKHEVVEWMSNEFAKRVDSFTNFFVIHSVELVFSIPITWMLKFSSNISMVGISKYIVRCHQGPSTFFLFPRYACVVYPIGLVIPKLSFFHERFRDDALNIVYLGRKLFGQTLSHVCDLEIHPIFRENCVRVIPAISFILEGRCPKKACPSGGFLNKDCKCMCKRDVTAGEPIGPCDEGGSGGGGGGGGSGGSTGGGSSESLIHVSNISGWSQIL